MSACEMATLMSKTFYAGKRRSFYEMFNILLVTALKRAGWRAYGGLVLIVRSIRTRPLLLRLLLLIAVG